MSAPQHRRIFAANTEIDHKHILHHYLKVATAMTTARSNIDFVSFPTKSEHVDLRAREHRHERFIIMAGRHTRVRGTGAEHVRVGEVM